MNVRNAILLTIIALIIVYLNYYFPATEKIETFVEPIPTVNPTPSLPHFLLGGEHLPTDNLYEWTDSIQQIGMNTVAISVTVVQGDWQLNNLSKTTPEQQKRVIERIRAAKDMGLHVILLPKIILDAKNTENQSFWHGMILPKNDSLLLSWFEKYQYFIHKWAVIAELEKVDVFSIGNELCALTSAQEMEALPPFLSNKKLYNTKHITSNNIKRPKQIIRSAFWASSTYDDYWEDAFYSGNRTTYQRKELLNQQWEKIITETKNVYSGSLMYVAHFENYQNISFWEQLDMIGINAHFPLLKDQQLISKADTKTFYKNLKDNWINIFETITTFKNNHGLNEKAIIFPEISYTFYENATIAAWKNKIMWTYNLEDIHLNRNKNFKERTLAVNALKEVEEQYKELKLKGVLYHPLTLDSIEAKTMPFSVQIGRDSEDQLQEELLKFLEQKKNK